MAPGVGILDIIGTAIWLVGFAGAVVGWMVLFVVAFSDNGLKGFAVLLGPFVFCIGAVYPIYYIVFELKPPVRHVVILSLLGGLGMMGLGSLVAGSAIGLP